MRHAKKDKSILTLYNATVAIRLLFILLVINIVSCGKSSISWPANIKEFSDFDKNDQNDILLAINDLNMRNSRPFLSFSNEYPGNQDIYFKMMDQDLPSNDGNTIVAQAYVELNKCTIEVFPSAFKDNILKPVIWHELGHCSGLEHSDSNSDIMYWLVAPFLMYNENSIKQFLFNLTKSLK